MDWLVANMAEYFLLVGDPFFVKTLPYRLFENVRSVIVINS